MKKILTVFSVILTVIMAVSCFGFSAYSASYFNAEGFQFLPTDNGNAVIYGYTGGNTQVEIPEKLAGYNVISIADNAFLNKADIIAVSFEKSLHLRSLGASAFAGCKALKSISIPQSVTSVSQSAFQGCTALESVTLGTGLTEIPDQMFFNCSALKSIVIPDNIRSIGYSAFGNCTSLITANISYMTAVIGDGAFSGCGKLTIFGYSCTGAESYALEASIPFIALNEDRFFDLTGDGSFDVRDINHMQKMLVGLVSYDNEDLVLLWICDVNSDSQFDVRDVTALQEMLAGICMYK